VNNRAALFGQSCGIAGDHLSSPDDFKEKMAAAAVLDLGKYISSALENSAHFHPEAPRAWRKYHALAIAAAAAIGKTSTSAMQDLVRFEDAFYTEAYASHFLQDSFAAGHGGFARVATRPSVSGYLHDWLNSRGRPMLDGEGRRWYGLGDGMLDEPENRANREHVLAAQVVALRGFLLALGTGDGTAPSDIDVWNRFPTRSPAFDDNVCGIGEECFGKDGADAFAPLFGFQNAGYVKFSAASNVSYSAWSNRNQRVLFDLGLSGAAFGNVRLGGALVMEAGQNAPDSGGSAVLVGGPRMFLPIPYSYPSVFAQEVMIGAYGGGYAFGSPNGNATGQKYILNYRVLMMADARWMAHIETKSWSVAFGLGTAIGRGMCSASNGDCWAVAGIASIGVSLIGGGGGGPVK
jgi:hypothetical protein